jgi:N-formylglutamate amidohydrolase
VPQRTSGVRVQDTRTREIAELVASHLETLLCGTPYVVLANFHRRYLDVNRPLDTALESPFAIPYYHAYHDAIRRFVDEIHRQSPGRGLLVDVHGQALNATVIYRGTQNGRTVSRLLADHGESALVGPNSVFGRLRLLGYEVFPPNTPLRDPPELSRFGGGYTVRTYGSEHPDGIDALQLELGSQLRQPARLMETAWGLADGITTYYRAFVDPSHSCAPTSPKTAPRIHAEALESCLGRLERPGEAHGVDRRASSHGRRGTHADVRVPGEDHDGRVAHRALGIVYESVPVAHPLVPDVAGIHPFPASQVHPRPNLVHD